MGYIIVLVALVHLANAILAALPDVAGAAISLQRMLGIAMAPVCWLMGIPWEQAATAGGLHAKVRSIEDDVLEIELAPGTIVRLDRRAVAAVVSEPEPDTELEEPEMPHPEQQIPPDDG